MLDAQVVVDLLLKLGVRMNLSRHGNSLARASTQKAARFHTPKYYCPSHDRYRACVGFFIATRGVIRTPPFGLEFAGV
jgi:hypothetical protein